jgi:hypothetical protein
MTVSATMLPRILALAVAFGATGLLGGCESAARAPAAPGFVSIERVTAGGAAGPAYLVTLFEDGQVLFEGHSAVKSKGTFAKRIPATEAARIFGELEAANIWERDPRYDVERGGQNDNQIVRVAANNAPRENLTVRRRGRFKRIDGLFFAPRELLEVKNHIEQAIGLAEWIGPPGEWKN